MPTVAAPIMEPSFTLPARLAGEAPLSACFQCKKCSGGCPLTFAMDLLPDQVIRLALLGQAEQVLSCRTIWVCSSCQTCTTRCPNNIDIAGAMDWLKEEALRQGISVPQPEVAAFYRAFLDTVLAGGGRLSEARMLTRFFLLKIRHGLDAREMAANARLGWKLMKRGRLPLTGPPALKGRGEIRAIFQRSGWRKP